MASASRASFSPNAEVVARILHEEGAAPELTPAMSKRLTDWFVTAAQRDNVKFLFSPDHLEAVNELSLSTGSATETLRVDRTFVTASGERWVIDFKFSEPSQADEPSEWIAIEVEHYRPQLRGYMQALRAWDESRGTPRPVVAALYFPWLDRLVRFEV